MPKPSRLISLFFSVTSGITLGFAVYGTQVAGFVPYV